MKIIVIGTRGFPDVQGGVERHCENLYPLLANDGNEVVVLAREPYVGKEQFIYKNVKIRPVPCPKNKFFEAFIHTVNALLVAKRLRPDIVHIHAIGPSLLVPFAKLLNFKVVMTHHGPDYQRAKWNRFAKWMLRLGEANGCRASDAIIAISKGIAKHINSKFHRDSVIIPNGVNIPQQVNSCVALHKYRIESYKYILAVGRFVKEKGFHDLLAAWQKVAKLTSDKSWKLVIVGDADHEDVYSRKLKEMASATPQVVLTGFLTGQPLQEIYSHAGMFVLPSYYEGLPIVLLEALSYGLSCIVSDIPANREVFLPEERYFVPGDVEGIALKLNGFLSKPFSAEERTAQIAMLADKYNWVTISTKTHEVYRAVLRWL